MDKIFKIKEENLKNRMFLSTSSFFFNSFILFGSMNFLLTKRLPKYNKIIKIAYILSIYTLIEPMNFLLNLKISDNLKN